LLQRTSHRRITGRLKGSPNVRNPESLAVNLNWLQAYGRQFVFVPPEKGKMGQVAVHGLKPAVASQNLANPEVEKLICIERQHGDVLRRTRRGDGIEDRLSQVFAEKDFLFFQFQNLGHLFSCRQSSQPLSLLAG